ncbi:DUF523 domain-containing protein [Rhodococcus rhodochrous]|uniref:Uncharacterized protein n=1 Tax=Rhodococcus rhodochrous KG-21 TaxID=1441923 RepID=A0A0M8PKG1_RHORH|nr:DUF523 domain-containing protein [Rhodococcus rhodochrous]KOS58126.1 hypothetical protein Z051_00665 [Rhodococcus rhodochrous KG-21]
MPDRPILVSACLAGVPCRYNAEARPDEDVVADVAAGRAIAVCAEVLGGLPTPRPPAEIVGGDGQDVLAGRARVVSDTGADLTDPFVRGAEIVAGIAAEHDVREAVLQARSPSCGCGAIYDGTHSGTVTDGDGVLAALLAARGITVRARRGSRT